MCLEGSNTRDNFPNVVNATMHAINTCMRRSYTSLSVHKQHIMAAVSHPCKVSKANFAQSEVIISEAVARDDVGPKRVYDTIKQHLVNEK